MPSRLAKDFNVTGAHSSRLAYLLVIGFVERDHHGHRLSRIAGLTLEDVEDSVDQPVYKFGKGELREIDWRIDDGDWERSSLVRGLVILHCFVPLFIER